MRMFRNSKGQSTAEYVIVLGLIVASVMAMQTYIKRGFNAKIKNAVDYTDDGGTGKNIFTDKQYEPYYQKSEFSRTNEREEETQLLEDGATGSKLKDVSTNTGYQEQSAVEEE